MYLSKLVAFALVSVLGANRVAVAVAEAKNAFTTAVTVTFKVLVDGSGVPQSMTFISIAPPVDAKDRRSLVDTASAALRTWTFNQHVEMNGKPVASYVTVPVILDLAEPGVRRADR